MDKKNYTVEDWDRKHPNVEYEDFSEEDKKLDIEWINKCMSELESEWENEEEENMREKSIVEMAIKSIKKLFLWI